MCDVVLRLLAASVVHSVFLSQRGALNIFINAPTLAYLMERCESLKLLSLNDMEMDENHCRVLGDYSRLGLEVPSDCKLTNAGTSTLVEVIGRNQGPTKLDACSTDYSVLANGLRGNSRLKSFRPRISSIIEVGNQELLAIADALRENEGLIELDLRTGCFGENDETWGAICDSLKTHPALEVLHLSSELTRATRAPAVIKSRIQALLDMVKVNQPVETHNTCGLPL